MASSSVKGVCAIGKTPAMERVTVHSFFSSLTSTYIASSHSRAGEQSVLGFSVLPSGDDWAAIVSFPDTR